MVFLDRITSTNRYKCFNEGVVFVFNLVLPTIGAEYPSIRRAGGTRGSGREKTEYEFTGTFK